MFMPNQQFRHHQNMAGDVNDAISGEMRSRVSQSREQRRMQQEQSMKNMDIQALLVRLQHEREMAEKKMRYDFAMREIESDKARGVTSSTRWGKMLDGLS